MDDVTFYELSDGRGWVFDAVPGKGEPLLKELTGTEARDALLRNRAGIGGTFGSSNSMATEGMPPSLPDGTLASVETIRLFKAASNLAIPLALPHWPCLRQRNHRN